MGTTRRLILLRHAKSSHADGNLADFDRPLNERGERDAPIMGRRLLEMGVRPTLFLTSPAVRARRTAQIVAREIGYPKEFLQRESELYLAPPSGIIGVVARQEREFRDVIVCGHNPGLTELANELTGAGVDNIPTCGVAIVELALDDWADLPGARGRLARFEYPGLHRT